MSKTKMYMALLCIAMVSVVLSGCAAGNASGTTATAAPIVTNSPMATAATMTPMNSPAADAGMTSTGDVSSVTGATNTTGASGSGSASMTPAEAGRLSERIAEALERMSEIDDAEVIVDGQRALVAVEFDDQYSAGLDDRMKQMITQAVQKIDDSLTDVRITDDGTLYGQVKGLGERLMKATGLNELADDFGDLWNRITGM